MNQTLDIKPLTAVRFFAALWVVVFHYWPHLAGAGARPEFVARGYLGVEMFFVLSGFILCHVYLPQVEDKSYSYKGFLWARIARIYPLHIATLIGVGGMALAATAAGIAIDPHILSWKSLAANLSMTQAWGLAPEAGWNHPSWSISAEWFAYLTFPLFAVAALALKSRPYVAAAGAAALLTGLYLLFPLVAGFRLTQATIAWGALRIVPCFALGCAAYLVWRSRPISKPATALAASALLVTAAVVMAALRAHDALIVLTFGALMVSLASLTTSGSRFGSGPVGVWLGEVSYAVYMVCVPWQLLFVGAAGKLLGYEEKLPLWLWLVFTAGVLPVAALAHHLVERPARGVLRGFGKRKTAIQPSFA